MIITLEDVFISKLKTNPVYILELSRGFLEQDLTEESYIRGLIHKYVLGWMDEDEDKAEMGRTILGLEFVNLLRPI